MVIGPDCEDDVRVLVLRDGQEDVRLPIAEDGIEMYVRKDGPLRGWTRVTDVTFPASLNGVPYQSIVSALDPTQQNLYNRCQVQYRRDETWLTFHDGFALSAGSNGTNALRRLRIADYAHLLDAIPANVSFKNPKARDLFQYVQETFIEGQPILDHLPIHAVNQGETVTTFDPPDVGVESGPENLANTVNVLATTLDYFAGGKPATKEFKPNRDSLKDVLDWASTRLTEGKDGGLYFSFETVGLPSNPIGQGRTVPALFVRLNPTTPTFGDKQSGGAVGIYEHNALYEVSPVNQILVRGRTRESYKTSDSGQIIAVDATVYPQAVAEHPQLRERAGGILRPKVQETDATTISQAETDAKSILKDSLDEAGGGDIRTTPIPNIRPYAEFQSKLACDDELDAISFEVESVEHHFPASGRDETILRVSMFVDPDDIEIVQDETRLIEV